MEEAFLEDMGRAQKVDLAEAGRGRSASIVSMATRLPHEA